MLTFYEKYKKDIHSQNGEDGIIEECIKRIKPTELTAVEFGSPSWDYCSNTAYLAEQGWKVRQYDNNPNPDPRIIQAEITPDNVNEIVGDPTILSIDIDNDDYYVWKEYNGSPDIVIIEINSSFEPGIHVIPGVQGTSYSSMVQLGLEKGYFLLCHTGNLIFFRGMHFGRFPEIHGFDPRKDSHLYFNKSFLC